MSVFMGMGGGGFTALGGAKPQGGRRLLALAAESLISYVSFFQVHWKEQMLGEEEKPAGIYEVVCQQPGETEPCPELAEER